MEVERLVHLSYLPDLSPCDFEFFGWAKRALRNLRSVDSDNVVEVLTNRFDSVTFDELQRVFQSWIRRLEWVVRNSAEYFPE
jgi:hypothetical protein